MDIEQLLIAFGLGVLQIVVPIIVCLFERGKDDRFEGDGLIYRS